MWDLLADGRLQKQVAEILEVSQATVSNRINAALKEIRGWAGREAEDWRNKQLLILDKQISETIDDTQIRAKPLLDEDGGQLYTKNGSPMWARTHTQAEKTRNMARTTLAKLLKQQADLLSLTVERKEIAIDKKVAIGVYNFGTFEGAVSLDDLK